MTAGSTVFVHRPRQSRLKREATRRFQRRMRRHRRAFGEGALSAERLTASVRSWVTHAAWGQTYRLREDVLLPATAKFPRQQRFVLARQIEDAALAMHRGLLQAMTTAEAGLAEADLHLAALRTYLRRGETPRLVPGRPAPAE